MTSFGNRDFSDVISENEVIRAGPDPKRGNVDSETEAQRDTGEEDTGRGPDTGGGSSDASAGQETPA